MKAKKRFGQNFLINHDVIDKIVDEVLATNEDLIIEIGPGMGALTKKLKEKNAMLVCYEVDNDLKKILNPLENDKTKIIYQDFLSVALEDELKKYCYKNLFIVGNLPYYITTPIIEHVIKSNITFNSMIIMVQKEVALRFMAQAKNKDYGYITLALKYYFDITKVIDVSKYSFNPVPKVESTVIKLVPKRNKLDLDVDKYFSFLKQCFAHKRKTLKNNLGNYDWSKIKMVLEKHNLYENIRAEELEENVLIEIFKLVS